MSVSYASGLASKPLIGQTIDENLREAVTQYADREALVDVATKRRLTYRELDEAVEAVARGLMARGVAVGDRVGIWSPSCLGVVRDAVRHGTDRRDPGEHQPGVPHPRVGVRPQPGLRRNAHLGGLVQDQQLPGHGRRGRIPGAVAA